MAFVYGGRQATQTEGMSSCHIVTAAAKLGGRPIQGGPGLL